MTRLFFLIHYVVSAPPKILFQSGWHTWRVLNHICRLLIFRIKQKNRTAFERTSPIRFLSEARVHSICSFVRATSLLARAAHLAVTLRGARCV